MSSFRNLIVRIEQSGSLLSITREVDARFEISALLKEAEQQGKSLLFESVTGSPFPVVGNLLMTEQRFAQSLGIAKSAAYTREQHADLIATAIAQPLPPDEVTDAHCQAVVLEGAEVDCETLPVPTFFAEDSGPFLTAAIGIARNPENGVLNAGIYRVLMLGPNKVAVSVGPSSGLLKILAADAAAGLSTHIALVIGAEPAVTMAAVAKVPPEISELDVAGAMLGAALDVVKAVSSDLRVPASAEFVLEVEIKHDESMDNTMGEFGDLYGTQLAHVGTVNALTHRENPFFHAIQAGAGREHNSLGLISLYSFEPDLQKQLRMAFPDISAVRVLFHPPSMGSQGEIYLQCAKQAKLNADELFKLVFGLKCGGFPVATVIRRLVLVDADIAISDPVQIRWAVSNRVVSARQHTIHEDLDGARGRLRVTIDATMTAENRETLQRLKIPGSAEIRLKDYL